MRSARFTHRVVLAAALLLASVHESRADGVQVARDDAGLTVSATGARLEDVLDALAHEEGFAVSMQLGLERTPVDVDVRDASVEEVLRHVLRRRNYVIAYRETENGPAVSRVEVLLPRAPSDPAVASQRDRAQSAIRAAQQRNEARRRKEAEQRFESMRAEQRQARLERARQARAAGAVQQAQADPPPLRRMLWSRSPSP